MTTAIDGHAPSPGWSPTILRMITPPSKIWAPTFPEIVNLFPKDGHQLSPGWPNTIPTMVIHHLKVGHPLSQGYGRTPSPGWSPTNIRMITTIHGMVITNCLQDGLLDLEFYSKAAQFVKILPSYYPEELFSGSLYTY